MEESDTPFRFVKLWHHGKPETEQKIVVML